MKYEFPSKGKSIGQMLKTISWSNALEKDTILSVTAVHNSGICHGGREAVALTDPERQATQEFRYHCPTHLMTTLRKLKLFKVVLK